MSAAAVALLLALRCLGPVCDPGERPNERAPAYVRCERCQESWVVVKYEWCSPDSWVELADQCGRTHWHDTTRTGFVYVCLGCCREWTVEGYTGAACWCLWEPGDDGSVLLEPCPDISDEFEPEG